MANSMVVLSLATNTCKLSHSKRSKLMELTKFHNICRNNGYGYRVENGVTYFTDDYQNLYFSVETLPENIIFKNRYTVSLTNLKELPASVIFENSGGVNLGVNTKIPANYKGFKQLGTLTPEHPKYIKPKYYIADDFYAFLLENSKYKYCDKLSKLQNTLIKEDAFQASYISYNDGMVSFLPFKSVLKDYLLNKKSGDNFDNYSYKNKVRLILEGQKYSVKVGRFIQKIFPEITDTEAEEFVNICKNYKPNSDYEFVVFTGEDIRKYYNSERQELKNGSRIFNSCMNWKDGTEKHRINGLPIVNLLDFYVENPNCGLLALKHKTEDKIIARALIWTTTNGKKYIEMTYVNNDSQDYLFQKYAVENKCLSYHNGDRGFTITCPDKIKELKVLPTYLDSLVFDKEKNSIRR